MSLNCCCGSCYDNNERLCCCDWSKLPDDLMVEILCRLPEKPLIQFKCVSKAWYLLISNVCVPGISASAPRAGFLVQWTTFHGGINFVEYRPCNQRRDVGLVESYSAVLPFQPTAEDFLDCCNGLLLFVKRFSVPAKYYVCNPATKQEVFYFGIPWKVFDYFVKTNQFKVFCELEDDRFIITGQMSSFPYSRCLVVLNDFTRESPSHE